MPQLHFNAGNHNGALWFAAQQAAKKQQARRRTGRNTFGTGEEQLVLATTRDDDYHNEPDGVSGYAVGVDPGFEVADLEGHTDMIVCPGVVMHLGHTAGAAAAPCERVTKRAA